MAFDNLGVFLSKERSKPDSCQITFSVDRIGKHLHSAGEFFRIRHKPVADLAFKAVVNLED